MEEEKSLAGPRTKLVGGAAFTAGTCEVQLARGGEELSDSPTDRARGGGASEVELVPAKEPAAGSGARADADGDLLVRLGRGGFYPRSPLLRALRLCAWLCACALLLPLWAACAAAEALVAGQGSLRCKMAAWRFVSLVWDDAIVATCALLPSSYGGHAIWCFPPSRSNGCCALTIDDAPGRDPLALCELLDVLRDAGAAATFFVTTDYAECLADDAASARLERAAKAEWRLAVRAALRRAVAEGHELAHHMPKDMPYAQLCERDEGAFRAELARAERVLRAVHADARGAADAPPGARGADGAAAPHGCWFRPPSAVLSARMASIVRGCGYRIVLCDAYSADPWIDGGAAPLPHVTAFHAAWLGCAMQPGSIAVMHTPERESRRQTIGTVRALLPALAAKGLRAVTLSQLAAEVLAGGAEPEELAAPVHGARLGSASGGL